MSDHEREWVRRAQQGDEEAFCRLAERYERRIYRLAWHYCRNPQDAEDLSQEVWLKAFRAIGGFRGESNFYTWLRQITIHTFLNGKPERASSTKKRENHAGMEVVKSSEDAGRGSAERVYTVEAHLHNRILFVQVMQALRELTPHERLIFLLKHHEGMTYEEIAKACNCSTGTIKKTLFRAVSKLRNHLGIRAASAD